VVRDQRIEDLEQFLAQRGQALLRTSVLLAGGVEAGEDLLQHVLAEAGIPALVRWGELCWVPPSQYLPTRGIVDGPDYVGGVAPPIWIGGRPYPNTVWTFTPSKMPPGARYMITVTPANRAHPNGGGDWSRGLVRDSAHLTCRPTAPPAGG
jgi:hypothetical protein